MLIGKFKSNRPFLFPLLLVVAALLWLDGFLGYSDVVIDTENTAPLYALMGDFFNRYPLLSVLFSFVFMLLQATVFNSVIAGKNIVDRNSQLPALLYIVLMSNSFGLMGMHPVWFANFFLILALNKIFDVFTEDDVFLEVFNVGFFVSLASLFYVPSLWFILLLISSLIIYYLVNIRGILASVIGFVTPYLFVFLYYFWHDIHIAKFNELFDFSYLLSEFNLSLSLLGWTSVGIIGFVVLIALVRIYLGGMLDKPVRIRKRFNVLLAFLFISLLTLFFAGEHLNYHQGLLMLPLSAILAGYFQENKGRFWNELFFALLIILIVTGKIMRMGI